jgi:hypothetical protein
VLVEIKSTLIGDVIARADISKVSGVSVQVSAFSTSVP